MLHERVARFYDYLLDGDADTLAGFFPYEPDIDMPLDGKIKGAAALEKFVPQQQIWLTTTQARPEICALMVSDERLVAELVLHITPDEVEIDLPVALIAELIPGGVSAIRIYHRTCPLVGE